MNLLATGLLFLAGFLLLVVAVLATALMRSTSRQAPGPDGGREDGE